MEVFYLDKTEKLPLLEICCATIGNFDGIHLGHQNLIKSTKEEGFKSLVITFDSLTKENNSILSLDDKIELLESYEIDYLIVLKYEDFKMMFYDEFIKMLKKMKVKKIVIGKDFRFGFKQEGDYIDLDKKFELNLKSDILDNNIRISSTLIRKHLNEGNIKEVNKLLGYNYFVTGNVVTGNQLGRTIGFPTANLDTYNNLIKVGVYHTKTIVDDVEYNSITNIGKNPTFNLQDNIKIETYIIDFNEDIYDKKIKIIFLDKIRDEEKFNSKEELIETLNKDVSKALQNK